MFLASRSNVSSSSERILMRLLHNSTTTISGCVNCMVYIQNTQQSHIAYYYISANKAYKFCHSNKSSQRLHTSAKENMVEIRSPYPDTDSRSLSKDTSMIKLSRKSNHSLRRYKPNCGKIPYLAIFKNPLQNSWIQIQRRMTSKI